MDAPKALTLLTAMILIVCLVLSITSLVALRHAVDESAALRLETQRLTDELESCIEAWKENEVSSDDSLPTVGTTPPTPCYSIRSIDNKIAIYTEDGALVQVLDVDPDSLPAADRAALADGIEVEGWQAVLSRIADYTT